MTDSYCKYQNDKGYSIDKEERLFVFLQVDVTYSMVIIWQCNSIFAHMQFSFELFLAVCAYGTSIAFDDRIEQIFVKKTRELLALALKEC